MGIPLLVLIWKCALFSLGRLKIEIVTKSNQDCTTNSWYKIFRLVVLQFFANHSSYRRSSACSFACPNFFSRIWWDHRFYVVTITKREFYKFDNFKWIQGATVGWLYPYLNLRISSKNVVIFARNMNNGDEEYQYHPLLLKESCK